MRYLLITNLWFWLILISLAILSACHLNPKSYSYKNLAVHPSNEISTPDTTEMTNCFKDVARDTWLYFDQVVDRKNGLVTDKINITRNEVAGFTSITNIGLQMVAIISAMDFGFIDSATAEKKVEQIVKCLQKLPTHNGFLYNWYDLQTLQQAREYISSVDAAWLYSSLAIVTVTFPDLADECETLSSQADFGWLYDDSLHQFYLGYDTEKETFSPYHYGMLCSESRMCLYYGIITGKVKPENWYYLERTLPTSFKQQQTPLGDWKTKEGILFFDGFYEYNDQKIVPSWGGALFEFFMPTLFVNELKHSPEGIGKNNCQAASIHREYALNQMNYPIWGMSPSSLPDNGYGEFGVPEIGSRKDGYQPGIVSPHASILTVSCIPEAVYENLKVTLKKYPIYGRYGFYDSIDPKISEVGKIYLALDQAMILISLNNFLNNSAISRRFEKIQGFEKVRELLNKDRMMF